MAEEATVGPGGLLAKRRQRVGKEEEEEEEEGPLDDRQVTENLRRYELDRLRYYFGVVRFESVATSERVYAECDGAEFESSSLPLDLRFIPEDMRFDKPPRDSASELPADYSAPSFMCSALQQSKPTLSWDQDDTARVATMRRDLSKAEVKEMDYAAYLASDDSADESDEGVEEYAFAGAKPPARAERQAGLGELLREMGRGEGDGDEGREVSFSVPVENGVGGATAAAARKGRVGSAKLSREEEEEKALPPTVFEVEEEKRKQKRREKKAQRQAEATAAAGGDGGGGSNGGGARSAWDDDDDFFAGGGDGEAALSDDGDLPDDLADDPYFKEAIEEREREEKAARAKSGRADAKKTAAPKEEAQKKKRSRKKKGRGRDDEEENTPEAARRKAQLEMLMLGDAPEDAREARRGYDVKELLLPKGASTADAELRGAKGKRKRMQAAQAEAAAGADDFSFDTADSRFASIYSSHDFAIDPTDPKFRRTAGSEKLLVETQKAHADDAHKSYMHSARHAAGNTANGASGEQSSARRDSGRESEPASGGGDGLWSLVSSVKSKVKASERAGAAKKNKKAKGANF